MRPPAACGLLRIVLVVGTGIPVHAAAQGAADAPPSTSWVVQDRSGLSELLVRLERAYGVVLGQLASRREASRTGSRVSTFEVELFERLTEMVEQDATLDSIADEAAQGYAVLGARGIEIIARAHAFQREVIAILADRTVLDRRTALREAVERYRSNPGVALPSSPKDMDVLYVHPHALGFRTGYPDLAGLLWAGHWYRLAATEPLTDLSGAERAAGLDTVLQRFHAKLTRGAPPDSLPSQIPLAPAIAPGLIYLSPESAIIWDNLTMLQEVLADVMASPEVTDVATAINAVIEHFMDPSLGTTDRAEWEIMALRHGIFFQGGYPLGSMSESERNVGGHADHLRSGGAAIMPGMPG